MYAYSMLNRVPRIDSLEGIQLQKLMDMDVAFQLRLKELQRKWPLLLEARHKGGSGLQMANLLRNYSLEYSSRLSKHGVESFPSSFNVVEAFLSLNHDSLVFDIRDEREHLLCINYYFRWYRNCNLPSTPEILKQLMPEGIIHSYDMVSGEGSLRIDGQSKQVFAGVSLIRHDHELSCLLLAGENPAPISDDLVAKVARHDLSKSSKGLSIPNDLGIEDRYLDGFPNFAKVIAMTRFDLRARTHDVRYVNRDEGAWFSVFTDDFSVFGNCPEGDRERLQAEGRRGLVLYDDLFAALSALIYLPAFFAAFPKEVHELKVSTALSAMNESKRLREFLNELGEVNCPMSRNIRCFPVIFDNEHATRQEIDPPEMHFKTDGYWRTIAPHEIGEGKKGERLFGRTWVSRHESWSARSAKSFILERPPIEAIGPDPGIVYVVRSPALDLNLYKVGLTRRDAKARASELSSASGVPLPFGVLANWSVGDCTSVERNVHERLAPYRINDRREFFRAELSVIVKAIELEVENHALRMK